MLRSQRTNLMLLGLILGLLLLVNLPWPGTESPNQARLPLPESRDHLILYRGTDDVVELSQIAGQWQMLRPLTWPANVTRIQGLLQLLQQPHYGQFPSSSLHLEEYGLAPAVASLEINGMRYDFGATEPLNNRRYLLHQDTIYLVDDRYFYQLAALAERYLDLRLLPHGGKLTALQQGDYSLKLQDGKWQGEVTGLSTDQLIERLQNWQRATALSVEYRPDLNSEGTPLIHIELQGPQQTVSFALIQQQPDLLLWRLDKQLLYRFHPHQGQQLLLP